MISPRALESLFNHDFCPWANRYVYWLKRPIGWFLVAAVASLLVGIAVAPQGLVMFGAIVTVMVLGVCWPWLCMARPPPPCPSRGLAAGSRTSCGLR